MDIKLYDANFETTGKVIDTFSSLSYTDRWNADGDFKLVLPVGDYNTVKDAKYLSVDGRTYEISQINTADTSASNELTISGHNLNVLLDRVVITTPARIQGNLEEQIRTLVSDYAITGWQSVPRLVLGALNGYTRAIDANATRGSLGAFLYTELNKRGFSFELNYDPAADEITFDIVQSKDRTEDQTFNAQAVFSAQKENLENMEYERNETEYYNCAVVCDEDPDAPTTTIVDLSNGEPKRTVYIAASNVYEDTENPQLYVMVGAGGYIATSTDGQTWTQQASGTAESLWSVDYQNGRFIVCGDNGTILTSSDGVAWSIKSSGVSAALEGALYDDGLYIATGNSSKILTSYDSATWTERYAGRSRIIDPAKKRDGFIAVGSGGYYVSPDAITWTRHKFIVSHGFFVGNRTSVVNNNITIAGYIDDSGSLSIAYAQSSNDGESFSVVEYASPSNGRMLDMVYGLGVYVAVGQPNIIQWSSDGITWTDCTPSGSSADYITVTFDGTLFHAYSGTTKHHAYSADGKNWTQTTFTTTATVIDSAIYSAAQRQYSLYSIGYNALQNYKMVELVNGDLLPTARPMIGTDCNVGDIVDIVDKERGIIVSKILSEAQTVYERDKNGIIYPNFGDGYLDLKKYIKKEVDKRG